MALLEWSDRFSVGIPAIDEQHGKIIDLINELHQAMHERRGQEVLGRIFDELLAYTQSHFAFEEQLLERHGYPRASQHRAEHQTLMWRAELLQSQYRGGKVFISTEVLTFLKDWLAHHIGGSDQAYAQFLRSKGQSGDGARA